VAVLDEQTGRWTLVDPTNNVVITDAWDPQSKIYAGPGGRYWIWYRGDLADLPAKNHDELKAQYQAAWAAIPAQVWDDEVVQLDCSFDDTAHNPDGS